MANFSRLGFWLSGAIVALVIVLGCVAPFIPYQPEDAVSYDRVLSAPSMAYLFGTDEQGRDIGWPVLGADHEREFAEKIAVGALPQEFFAGHQGCEQFTGALGQRGQRGRVHPLARIILRDDLREGTDPAGTAGFAGRDRQLIPPAPARILRESQQLPP